jgi:hypothetical protein
MTTNRTNVLARMLNKFLTALNAFDGFREILREALKCRTSGDGFNLNCRTVSENI